MNRRTFVTVLAAVLAAPRAAEAQQPGRLPRIGAISAISPPATSPFADQFAEGLHEHGYAEGRDLIIEWRFADGDAARVADVARQLAQSRVDIIVAANNPVIQAAKRATATIPIVMVFSSDPVELGFVASLARPGGNITGFSGQTADLIGKRMQMLQEAVPNLSRVAVLWDPTFTGIQQQVVHAERAARSLGIEFESVVVGNAGDFDSAFAAMARRGSRATFVLGSSMHYLHRERIATLAEENRMPSACLLREFAEAGCLMSYSPDFKDLWRRAAGYVDKILKGARPASLPVQQPTKFEFVINAKTAKALGLTIPPSLLLRADQVIE
jgi:putative ABC transport system substrate-binding protein